MFRRGYVNTEKVLYCLNGAHLCILSLIAQLLWLCYSVILAELFNPITCNKETLLQYHCNIFKHNLECLFHRFVSIIYKEHVPMETVVVLTMSSHHLEGTVYLI